MARTEFNLTLRPLPRVDGVRAMRAALKALLRRYGLRAVNVVERDAGDVRSRGDNVTSTRGNDAPLR
jgi:hypothetical protein